MKLDFMYLPVPNMAEALAFYRDTLGLDEAWREGEATVALKLPGSELQLMLDEATSDRPGPVFAVDSVVAFHAARAGELKFVREPAEIPGGHWASFEDPAGNHVYLVDQSTAQGG
jgi:catechol 2,3-dioxygenase-like lactoylglutathione lyase family enzyme